MTKYSLSNLFFGSRIPRSVAVIGSGGKSTTISLLAEEFLARGKRVIITPTTKMFPPEDRTLLSDNAADALKTARKHGVAYIGVEVAPGKMRGLPIEEREALLQPDVVVLSESDGSRTLPMKATAEYEPVIPPDADAVLLLFGLDSMDRPLAEVCHRPELAERILGLPGECPVTPEMVAAVLRASYFDRLPGLDILVVLNKCDDESRASSAAAIEALLPNIKCVRTCLKRD